MCVRARHRDQPCKARASVGYAARVDDRDVLLDVTNALAALGAAALIAWSLCGCGASAVQQQAQAIAIVADLTAGGEDAIDTAARADLHASCPDLTEACADTVRARWAPADAAFDATKASLEAWIAALEVVRQAGTDPGAAAFRAVRALVATYAALVTALAEVGVTIPALPVLVTALVGAP